MTRKLIVAGLILVIVAGALAGVAIYAAGCVASKTRRAVLAALPGKIGPAGSYDVHVRGSAASILRGRLDSVSIRGDAVRLRNGPVLERLIASASDVRLDLRGGRVRAIGNTIFAASVTDAALTRYLRSAYPAVSHLSVAFLDGPTVVRGQVAWRGRMRKLAAGGVLKLVNGRLVEFVTSDYDIIVNGISRPGVASALMAQLNPVLDTSRWRAGVRLDSISVTPHRCTLRGRINLLGAHQR